MLEAHIVHRHMSAAEVRKKQERELLVGRMGVQW
jgi:hypothetical protein